MKAPVLLLLVFLGSFLSIFLKASYLTFLSYAQARFLFSIKAHIAQELFNRYVLADFSFHSSQNSANLIRNLTVEVRQLSSFYLNPILVLFSEATVVLCLAALLAFFEPIGFVILFSILVCSFLLLQRFTKVQLGHWGAMRQAHESGRVQIMQESFRGVVDLKINCCEGHFINSYKKHNDAGAFVESQQHFVSHLPRIWIEAIGVFSLVVLMGVVSLRDASWVAVISVVGVFGAAAFRILPSTNRIISSVQSIRYAKSVAKLIEKDFKIPIEVSECSDRLSFENNITFDRVNFTYPGSLKPVLKDLSLTIHKGECIGIIGESGAGKTIFVEVLLGLRKATCGQVFLDDVAVTDFGGSWRQLFGYVPQHVFLTDDSIIKNIGFGLGDSDIKHSNVSTAIKQANIGAFIRSLPGGLHTTVGENGAQLSGGQRQRIGLARAMYNQPSILVLDEATSALDVENEKHVISQIMKLKGQATILVITHRLSTLDACDRIFEIADGCVVAKSMK